MRFFVGLSLVVFLAGCELMTETIDPPKPELGERWLCGDFLDDEWSYKRSRDPSVVLTRETSPDEVFGYGKVVVGGVTYDAFVSIDGVNRRWDWSNDDMIVIGPGGDGLHYDFRFSDPDGMAMTRDFFKCFQG